MPGAVYLACYHGLPVYWQFEQNRESSSPSEPQCHDFNHTAVLSGTLRRILCILILLMSLLHSSLQDSASFCDIFSILLWPM